MSRPVINHPLVNPPAGTDRNERVPENMPATYPFPMTAGQRLLEMMRGFVNRQRMPLQVERIATIDGIEPSPHDTVQACRQWDRPHGSLAACSLEFSKSDCVRRQIEVGDFRAENLTPSGSRVSRQRQHRVKRRVQCVLRDKIQHLLGLSRREIQSLPEF